MHFFTSSQYYMRILAFIKSGKNTAFLMMEKNLELKPHQCSLGKVGRIRADCSSLWDR